MIDVNYFFRPAEVIVADHFSFGKSKMMVRRMSISVPHLTARRDMGFLVRDNEKSSVLKCAWCAYQTEWGLRVCRGCNADIVYGITRREGKRAFQFGLVIGFILLLVSRFRIAEQPFGVSTALMLLWASVLGMGVLFLVVRWLWLRGKVRFFRRTVQ